MGGINFNNLNNAMGPNWKWTGKTIGDIISFVIPYIFVLAGLGLFIFLIIGGFQLMTSGGDPKAMQSAKGKITNAVIGFIIIFVSYWLVQLMEAILGLKSGII